MVPVGIIEPFHKKKQYIMTCEVVSQSADIIKFPVDSFMKIIQSNSHVMSSLKLIADERLDKILNRIVE